MKPVREEAFTLEQRECRLWQIGEGSGPLPLVLALCGEQLPEELPEILKALSGCPPFLLCSFVPLDWNRDCTPWPAPSLFRGEQPFAGEGAATLGFLQELNRVLRSREAVSETLLLGYSLGGLLAFWAVCSSGSFAGCASCSGSLWYDGWLDFLEEHPPSPWQRVYLSLGRTEEKARNPRMAQVGEATRRSFERLQRAEVPSRLVWQDGGHFHQIPRRLAGALTSLLKMPASKEARF